MKWLINTEHLDLNTEQESAVTASLDNLCELLPEKARVRAYIKPGSRVGFEVTITAHIDGSDLSYKATGTSLTKLVAFVSSHLQMRARALRKRRQTRRKKLLRTAPLRSPNLAEDI